MRIQTSRRLRNIAILLAAIVLSLALSLVCVAALRDTARLSGWILLSLILFLAAYQFRKKLAFLPLGSSASWLQLHIYIGLLTAVVFGIHIHWHAPNGAFEVLLALCYALVFASGLLGLVISRSFARRLAIRGEEVLFERIPVYRKRLQIEVEDLVLRCLVATESNTSPQFYNRTLRPFFEQPRHFWPHLLESNRARHALLREMSDHNRYLNDVESRTMSEIASRVKAKDDLDYHQALQATLKYWTFAHVPLTYALLAFATFHALLVHVFSGGTL